MIKLVACDMDGTLLDSQKRLPADFPQVMTALKERGVCFAVASGRQYAALRRDFEAYLEDMMFICENGALVMQRDERLLIDPVDPRELYRIVTAAKDLRGVYPVVCRAEMALIEKTASPEFVRNTCMYYPSVQVVDDLTEYAIWGIYARWRSTMNTMRRRMSFRSCKASSNRSFPSSFPANTGWM